MQHLSKTSVSRAALIAGLSVSCLVAGANTLLASPVPPAPVDDGTATLQREEAPLSANVEALAYGRHVKARDQLQFPVGSTHSAKHIRDGFLGAEYDEVSESDTSGHLASLTQFDPDGRIRAAVRFDRATSSVRKTDAAGASAIAGRTLSALGIVPSSHAGVADSDEATNGWTVHWGRKAAGYTVRGDDTTVVVRPDGKVQSVSRVEHQLSPLPATKIPEAQATAVVRANADRWFGRAGSGYGVQSLELQWVEANNAFGPGPINNSARPFRLAWVGVVEPSGQAATYVTLLSVFVDAEDGTIIGGDVVE